MNPTNVLFILSDQHTRHALGCYGNPVIRTPHLDGLAACERELRAIVDPEKIDRRARGDQRRRIEAAGGAERIIAEGVKIPYTPAPDEFEPAPVPARQPRGSEAMMPRRVRPCTPGGMDHA